MAERRHPVLVGMDRLRSESRAGARDLDRARAAVAGALAGDPKGLVARIRVGRAGLVDPADDLAGLRPSASFGPFVGADGRPEWVDLFLPPPAVSVFIARPFGVPVLLARLPLTRRLLRNDRRQVGAGSAWVAAAAVVPGRPVDEYVGLRVRGGTLDVSGVVSSTLDRITLGGAEWRLVANLNLDVSDDPPDADGPGADAAYAAVRLPARARLAFGPQERSIQFDGAGVRVYGSSIDLTPTGGDPYHEPLSRSIVVPAEPSDTTFAFADVRAALVAPSGRAAIDRCGWGLRTVRAPSTALTEAAGPGSVSVGLAGPWALGWAGLSKPVAVQPGVLNAAPGSLALWATMLDAGRRQRIALWEEAGVDPARRSSIDVELPAGTLVVHLSEPGRESVWCKGRTVAHLDRPLAADGGRLAVRMPAATLTLVNDADGTTATVAGFDDAARRSPHLALALENALLTVRPTERFEVTGPLVGDHLPSGVATLHFSARRVLPTLPDPYAANFEPSRIDEEQGAVTARIIWPTADSPTLSVVVDEGLQQLLPQADRARSDDGRFRLPAALALLDVSSNADQFGVAVPRPDSLEVNGTALQAPAETVPVVTLPPISWEPMLTKTPTPASGDLPLPPPPHDGGPAMVQAEADLMIAIEPLPMLTAHIEAIRAERHFRARLPLPFGVVAQVDSTQQIDGQDRPTFIAMGGRVDENRPHFAPDLAGGRQLALRGAFNPDPATRDATFPGAAELRNEDGYAKAVLSTNIHTRFDGDFGLGGGNGIPLRHYELSGYGASLFSDWHDPEAVGPAVIQARFDVLVGRTAHEVIQMQSILYPLFVRVVRTITIDRQPGGWVLREDSGWVAATDGRLAYRGDKNAVDGMIPSPIPPAFDTSRRHPGVLEAAEAIRNIHLAAAQFSVAPRPPDTVPTTWQPVTFDCDVAIINSADPLMVVAAGGAGRRIPARGCTGWIQIDGPMYMTASKGQTVKRVRPADAGQIVDLLATSGPCSLPLDCVLHLGGQADHPGMVFQGHRLDVIDNGDAATPQLVAALRGSPLLPRDGAWSLARLTPSAPAPTALAPTDPVPLVRPNPWGDGATRWHLADPVDITELGDAANPTTRYGFVQSLGTQKVFFPRPRIGNGPKPISLPQPPHLADMGALLGAVGAFPGLADVFDFAALDGLDVTGGSVAYHEDFSIGSPGAIKQAMLLDLGGGDAIQIVIEYRGENEQPTMASVTVDPAASPRWTLSLNRVCFRVLFKGKPLISIYATVKGDEHTAPTVVDLRVHYGDFLHILQAIFSNIQQVARFLPGGQDAGLRVGLSQGHLTVHNDFSLPNLPLGAGQITDVTVRMGFEVSLAPMGMRFMAGLGSPDDPFRWVVSPLAGTGCVQVGIDASGLDVVVQCGLGLGLAIDLGIASGSASIALAFELNTGPEPFEVRVILSGRASVDVLGGLASTTITLAASLGVIPPDALELPPFAGPLLPLPDEIPPITVGLTASVWVGIHISVCWVIDVDWEGSWQFRQDITTPAIPVPV